MPTPLRRRLRHARRGVGYSMAVLLVLVALLLGVASQVLPMAERNPDKIAAWLSQRAGRPVSFDRVETAWTRRGPLLQLDNLRIGAGTQAFTVGDAEMLVSVYAGLLPGRPFSELRLRGLDLTLERAADGRWQVRGLPGQQQPGADPLAALEGLGELQVIDAKLAVVAATLGIDARLPKVDLRLRVDGDRVRAGVRAWPNVDAAPLDAALDFDRKRGDGQAYAGAKRADLAAWSSLLQLAGVSVEGGQGSAEAWAELRGHRIAQVTVDAALKQVALRGAPFTAQAPPPRIGYDRVEARARWRMTAGGWRFDAPTLRIGSGPRAQQLDGLLLAGGARYALRAEQLDAAPLLAVAALSDRLPLPLRQWIQTAQPRASLRAVDIAGGRGGRLDARARIDGFGFRAVGHAPGVQGLAGDLDGDADGFAIKLDPAAAMRLDWPGGFGMAHTARLHGTVSAWREGAGWRVGSPALRIDGGEFGVNARGGLWWQGDGSRPWIDLAAEIDATALPRAKGFWLRHAMSPRLVQWLDGALVAGQIKHGRALVSGDLDDWPFRSNGRFEATAHLSQATLKFHPDWPAVDGVEADAAFIADGFTVDGSGRLGKVAVEQLHAGIDHYKGGALVVQARGGGDAAQLLDVLRHSPLQKQQPETFANLSASGPAQVGFELTWPLRRGSAMSIAGDVMLADARLADARWKLAFDQVGGRAEYSRSGFHAEGLRVRHDGQPGRLSLRAGDGHVRERGNVFEAGLDATLDADALVDRAPDLAWLKPYLDGRSAWTVGIAIPKSPAGKPAPTLLQLRSNLVGTALDLPEPLRKPAGAALATTVETPLPLGSGDVRVGLGTVMALRARNSAGPTGAGQTGVRVLLGANRVDQAAPVSGLIATGRAGTLDALDWIALARGGKGPGAGGLPLQRIDVTAQRLQLLGGSFPNTRVVVVPAPGGATAVRAEGAALDGAVLVPAGEGAIAGRFDRFHWRSDAIAAAGDGAATAGTAARPAAASAAASAARTDTDIDPARVPSLTLDIGDLRIAGAALGAARLRTRATSAGMRIDQLQTHTGKQRIDLSGDWTGRGVAARTRLRVAVASDDFGALLNGFGMGGRLAGGNGTARFDAGWPGSPAAFQLEALEGSLVLDARDGRLLQVEPGAGRVLGLLSLAELPRRLTLDFRDFFSKGFAFNRIGGTVRFDAGSARSEGLVIDGPAAAITIHGAANLRAQSFDQTIEVRPKSGNLLTAVGMIAGGPVGAALGAAANAVLKKPLGQLGAKTYRVTGPWKQPKVEVITREQSRISPLPSPPPAG